MTSTKKDIKANIAKFNIFVFLKEDIKFKTDFLFILFFSNSYMYSFIRFSSFNRGELKKYKNN